MPQAAKARVKYERETVEFSFCGEGPIGLADLATSFAALDSIYSRLTDRGDRLSVASLRSGSIIAELAPFMPIMAQAVPYMGHAVSLSDFIRKAKKAIDAFAEMKPNEAPEPTPDIAAEIAEVMKPLAGRKDASFSIARVRYKSQTKERVVEVEAAYDADAINRAVINAERYVELSGALLEVPSVANEDERNLLRHVPMTLHQANRGPAKSKGTTGDRGIVESISDKPLPVYFAEGVNKLKDRMVRSTKNPLKYVYIVDVWVHRQNGVAKAYTVTEVHKAAQVVEGGSLPLLEAPAKRARKRASK